MYDWANSAFMATILQVFPIFFVRTAAANLAPDVARARFAFFTSAAVITVALIGPLLGAVADHKGNKKGFLAEIIDLDLDEDMAVAKSLETEVRKEMAALDMR
jgi:MFS-type transporter involved in bile tolerance (Atg22 family)